MIGWYGGRRGGNEGDGMMLRGERSRWVLVEDVRG